jgi:hypothetical protein
MVAATTRAAWCIDANGLFLVFADVYFSMSMMRKADLIHCQSKCHYACGLVECMKDDRCEFSIDCADAGNYCGHPSVGYSETMHRALIAMRDQERAIGSAAML